jgi:hypothetical protein
MSLCYFVFTANGAYDGGRSGRHTLERLLDVCGRNMFADLTVSEVKDWLNSRAAAYKTARELGLL